jgi:uncharacterized protein YdeI (YjbR/CyaY-like superfamily)
VGPTSEAIFFETPDQLRDWLDEHHETAPELIVGAWKKATGKPSLTWPQIVEEALCVGWIDSVRRSVPGDGWTIRLTPRRKGSIWSAVNVAKVAELRAAGRMRPAGEAAFAARREDRTAVYSFERAAEPELTPDEEARFRANEAAWAWFAARPPSFRRQVLHWVVSAKRPETRERRLTALIDDSAERQPPKPLRPARPGEGAADRRPTDAAEPR